jgi:hypothetical protein
MGKKPSEGRIAYDDIAEELGDSETSLSDLNPRDVEVAKKYAKKSHKRWPPRPKVSGWQIQIWSL